MNLLRMLIWLIQREKYLQKLEDYKKYLSIPVIYIPNSIEKLPNTFSGLNTNNIISVGRLESVKGFEDLIDVFKKVVLKNKNVKLNIVGNGSQYKLLDNKINDLGLQNNIKLLGYKNSKELSELYN